MYAVKVLPKGQITLPKEIRKHLDIKEGDTLILDSKDRSITLKKGRTLYDYIGKLPSLGMTIEEMREKAIKEGVKERA